MNQHPMVPQGGSASVAHQITHGPSFALLRVDLLPGQVLCAEAGAMVARSSHLTMDVKMSAGRDPGFFGFLVAVCLAFIRKLAGGESFFTNHFHGTAPGSVWVAPGMAGEVTHRRLAPGERLVLSSGAYLASVGDVSVGLKFGGWKTILAREGAFMLEVTGTGDVWFNSYGGSQVVEVRGPFMVDNGHLVGYEGDLQMNIRSAGGGLLGFVAGGEGLVCEFQGTGKIYVQSRNLNSLVGWLTPLLPQ